jgi:hypothetical protein
VALTLDYSANVGYIRATMDPNHRKDHFSRAVARAIAAAAGVGATVPEYDQNSRDVLFTADDTADAPGAELQAQLKCTSGADLSSDAFSFDLEVKDYNRLRKSAAYIPRILVVVVVPDDPADWIVATSPQEIALKRCAYWRSLVGESETTNTSTIAVKMRTADVFDVRALLDNLKPPGETL